MAGFAATSLGVAYLRGIDPDQRRAMLMTSIFYNSGNYGLPLQDLAFREANLNVFAQSLQVFVMIVQNLTSFTIGIMLAAGRAGDGQLKQNLLHIARFPPVYAIVAAFITIAIRRALGEHALPLATALAPAWDVIA